MRKTFSVLVALFMGFSIWHFLQVYGLENLDFVRKAVQKHTQDHPLDEVEDNDDVGSSILSLPNFVLGDKSENAVKTLEVATDTTGHVETPKKSAETLQIASFHLMNFGSKVEEPELQLNGIARVVRMCDVVALQGINPSGEASVIDVTRKAGPHYAYLFSKSARAGQLRFAFIYDTNTVVADKGEGLYTLGDPDNLLAHDPLIGWFKAKRPKDEDAFTFTLVNVHLDQKHVMQELNVLDNVIQEVRQDWRDEDDVIMLGCFHRSESQLQELGRVPGLVSAIRGTPTTLRGQHQTENLLFRATETDEFVGRSGVFQFLRAYNLDLEQASQISEFLPVWAEFSIYEGGQQGRVAQEEQQLRR